MAFILFVRYGALVVMYVKWLFINNFFIIIIKKLKERKTHINIVAGELFTKESPMWRFSFVQTTGTTTTKKTTTNMTTTTSMTENHTFDACFEMRDGFRKQIR